MHQPFLREKVIPQLPNPFKHKAGEGIFVLTKAESKTYPFNKKEKQILRPFHYAVELDRYYYTAEAGHYLIYTSSETAKEIEANPANYPNIKSHLDQYQAVITSDNKPYGIHRARQPEWFEDTDKIIGVRKTLYPKFTVIPESWYGDQAILIIRLIDHTQYSLNFITAILNSQVGHFWLFQQKRQGNQLQVDKEVLLNFPFPNLDLDDADSKARYKEIISLVQKVTKLRIEREEIKNSALGMFAEDWKKSKAEIIKYENQIDEFIFSIYGLDKQDENQIKGVIQEFSWKEQED